MTEFPRLVMQVSDEFLKLHVLYSIRKHYDVPLIEHHRSGRVMWECWFSYEDVNSYNLCIFALTGRKESTTGNVNPGSNKKNTFGGNHFTTQNDT
ncbi:hypothetical protein TNCV_151441 [Trichonephila clavipes]|uniref:Uncharacterized protein n=1 Tax=Trichonephila clavipes TaxID=2585209 RepID=A0A8X6RE57_TRICX|nr:hypothetical protein TNCV_151441 [Trichonephila clavipes]